MNFKTFDESFQEIELQVSKHSCSLGIVIFLIPATGIMVKIVGATSFAFGSLKSGQLSDDTCALLSQISQICFFLI